MNVLELGCEEILGRVDTRLDEYTDLAEKAATLEAAFKSWEALSRKAMIDNGKTATYSETAVKSMPEWERRYLELQTAQIAAENIKSRVHQGIRYFEAWRSKYSAEKRVT